MGNKTKTLRLFIAVAMLANSFALAQSPCAVGKTCSCGCGGIPRPSCAYACWKSKPESRAEEVKHDTISGIVTVELPVSDGQIKIKVTLPADVRGGDVISGTVVAETKEGQSSDVLEGAVLEIEGKQHPVAKKLLTFALPAVAGTALSIVLKDRNGKEIARGEVPINKERVIVPPGHPGPKPIPPSPEEPFPPKPEPLGKFDLPRICQTGRNIRIDGPFNGIGDDTNLSIGGNLAEFLAEVKHADGTGMAAFRVPDNIPTGPSDVLLKDNGREVASGKLNSLSVELSVLKTKLLRGEKTKLTAKVSGLQGLDEPVKLRLVNGTPNVVQFEGKKSGNINIIEHYIDPKRVSPEGTYVYTVGLRGLQPGGFFIQAGVQPARSKQTYTFYNNTGKDANDLHIEFNTTVDVTDSGPFQNVRGNNTGRVDLSGGAVNSGTTATIKVESPGDLHITRWWWTLNGKGIGKPYDGKSDPDKDGLNNDQEAEKGTNPDNPDTDGDGVKDGQDNFPTDPAKQ